ncbi:MAG: hypothetical protein IPN18_14660 [Ignavibacteriales bacterium]|nr:hypothetical protein [Ignavibacteriales bacterium]
MHWRETEIYHGGFSAYINDDIADSAWKDVIVPSYLENQGFSEFEGYAWYRIKFDFKDKDSKAALFTAPRQNRRL